MGTADEVVTVVLDIESRVNNDLSTMLLVDIFNPVADSMFCNGAVVPTTRGIDSSHLDLSIRSKDKDAVHMA